ncbi:retrovirus-like pol polyprotein, partial [Lasius niger]
KQVDGLWAPVSYYSQSTNAAEKNYHSFELEMLAVLRSIERFHVYLYGIDFTVVTDCHALVYAMNKVNLNLRIARWTLKLQDYTFKVKHRDGQRMAHVDALSRIVAYVEAMPIEKELQFCQLQDPQLKLIAESLTEQEHEKFEIFDGLVYKKDTHTPKFVVPKQMVHNIIRHYHDDMAHCGYEETVQGIMAHYWFPSLRKRIKKYIENCLVCLMTNNSANSREGELQITDTPSYPYEIVHTDHFGPLKEASDGSKHILILIDAFTRFTNLFPVKSTNSKETIKNLAYVFSDRGNPSTLVSDRGTAFTSAEFANFIESRKIKHRLVAVAAPWANGLCPQARRRR